MVRGLEGVNLFSNNPTKLADFYKEKVGLKVTLEAEMGDEGEALFGFATPGGVTLYITSHSKVAGQSQEPDRVILNWEVDDIEKDVKELVSKSVKKIRDIYHIQDFGYLATFADIDGNYFQLVQTGKHTG